MVFEVSSATAHGTSSSVPKVVAPKRLCDRAVLMQFESLGGSGHGCEFGLVQREVGAEPLGLLRWADIGVHLLVDALRAKFVGVGLPEHTDIFHHDHDEWWTRDKRYWMVMRTFVKTDAASHEEMATKVQRRSEFLRRKIIEDLQAGEKIFVYKDNSGKLPEHWLKALRAAMSSYGSNVLFYICCEDESHPNGTVEVVEPGLIVGYIDHFAFSAENKYVGPSMESIIGVSRVACQRLCSENLLPRDNLDDRS